MILHKPSLVKASPMTRIDHDFKADCTPQALWNALSDLTAVQHYNPTIASARLMTGSSMGIGATRWCDLKPKGRVVERVIHWEDGAAIGLEVAESDWPMRSMRWVTRISPEEGGARVTQHLDYEMKFGLLGMVLNALVLRRKLTANVGSALLGLISYAKGREIAGAAARTTR